MVMMDCGLPSLITAFGLGLISYSLLGLLWTCLRPLGRLYWSPSIRRNRRLTPEEAANLHRKLDQRIVKVLKPTS